MTKKEIYDYIQYQGVYDQDVRKRLNKLIKKYHPDISGDDKIIKIVYEVKKELENGSLTNNYTYTKKNRGSVTIDINTFLLINKLKEEVNKLNQCISSKYSDEYELLKQYNDVDRLYQKLKLNIKLTNKKISNLKNLDITDKILIFEIIAAFSFTLIVSNYISLIILVLLILTEVWYLIYKKLKRYKLKQEIKSVNFACKNYEQDFVNIKSEIEKIKISIFENRKIKIRKQEDIRFYEKEMNDEAESDTKGRVR